MLVKSVFVNNYRNLKTQTVTLSDGLNIFLGANAQGKTNFVESVYLCCLGKSPRTDKDKDLIKWGANEAAVTTDYVCRFGEGKVSVTLFSSAKKQIQVNSVPVTRTGDLLGYLNCVYFSPAEIKIISQSPAERRKFLDIDLCQTDKNYFYSLSRFNKALQQRNMLLKTAVGIDSLKRTLFAWDEILADEGSRIIYKRKKFCEMLKPYAALSHEKLTRGKEKLEADYVTQTAGETQGELKANYLKTLSDNVEKDFSARYTTQGCQRDDISLKVNGVDIRGFGSQGQQRTAALSLKLAETYILKSSTGEYPVLLLDDVLSELDVTRQNELLKLADETQVILTAATGISKSLTFDIRHKDYVVSEGTISEDK